MLMKPLNLIIVYILTIINFIILLLPFLSVLMVVIHFNRNLVMSKIAKFDFVLILNSLIFVVSFLMIFYLLLDFIFGFSVSSSLKNCKNYKKSKNYKFLDEIFCQVKQKFGRKDVKLYIKNSSEINAFAVGCMGKRVIVLTAGLINHALKNSKNKQEFLSMLLSIMGHEMSHLVNKDYLPALLIIVNQKATNLVSTILEILIRWPLIILSFFRLRSRIIFEIILFIYRFVNQIVTFFNAKIIFNLYEFIRRFISRSIEYRCDFQSSQAFGGFNMAKALSLFGNNGYITLFSTHPNTKWRIKKVEKVTSKDIVIKPLTSSSISNYFALMILIIICASSAKVSNADIIIREFLANHPNLFK